VGGRAASADGRRDEDGVAGLADLLDSVPLVSYFGDDLAEGIRVATSEAQFLVA